MSEIEILIKAYTRYVSQPWPRNFAGPQQVWFVVYEPSQERRLRYRIGEFEAATKAAGHGWEMIDLTTMFAEWMADHEYREAYFEEPEAMDLELSSFGEAVADRVMQRLTAPHVDQNTVVAILGLGSLFGLIRVSELFDQVAWFIQGRVVGFFPGRHEGSNYRLLNARDGWDYLAVPISAASEGSWRI